jgi:cell division protein FtsB
MSISPNVPSPQESYHYESAGTPRWITILFVILFVLLAALGIYGYSTVTRMSQDLVKQQEQNKVLSAELEQAQSRLADLRGHLDVTEQKIGMTQTELAEARSRAEAIRKAQQASDQKLTAQLTQAQQQNTQQINAVATEVGGAKKDIADTRTDLEATKAKLERATGDMGVMSGLIARNHDELDELKRRGERNYYEFNIGKSKRAQRVGPIQIKLNKTNEKKSMYTMTVYADDRAIEKKDRTMGEPVQFYVKGSHTFPYEIVVFGVEKNKINGYLSTPKETAETAAPAATPAAKPTSQQ